MKCLFVHASMQYLFDSKKLYIVAMQIEPSCFDAWQAIKSNQSTVEYLKNRIAQRRERFQKLCDGANTENMDVPMVPVPDASVLNEEGTLKLLTVLEVKTLF